MGELTLRLEVGQSWRFCYSFSIVFFTNGHGDEQARKAFKDRISQVGAALDVPFHLFAAWELDEFRMPSPGSWRLYVDYYNDGCAIGELAVPGRRARADRFAQIWTRASSSAVRLGGRRILVIRTAVRRFSLLLKTLLTMAHAEFAKNTGLPLRTPEEFSGDVDINVPFKLSGWDAGAYDHSKGEHLLLSAM